MRLLQTFSHLDGIHLTSDGREIEHLESRLKDLEEQLKEYKAREAAAGSPTPPPSNRSLTRTNSQGSLVVFARQAREEHHGVLKQWRGVRVVSGQDTSRTSYHGASSIAYFNARIDRYLRQALQEPYDERRLRPNTASSTFASPMNSLEKGTWPEYGDGGLSQVGLKDLSRPQEEMFLNLFWQSYHCLNPLLNESHFREHYDSLWTNLSPNESSTRRSSALIDIILANCMQYGMNFLFPRDDNVAPATQIGPEDASIAGQGFYARSQRLLEYDLETPSITTLHCHLFSIIYLWNASFINRADSTLAVAVRMAYMLGFNHEPLDTLAPDKQDLQKRLWWTLYIFDTQIGISLGRPFLTSASTITCSTPEMDPKSVPKESPHLTLDNGEISFYDYSTHSIKLAQAVRSIYTAFNERSSELIQSFGVADMQENPKVMEDLAGLLSKATKKIQEWADNVPEPLWSARKGNNEPFTAHRSALNIDLHQPLWLQRQRLSLILLYHEFMMVIFRPFIRIPPVTVSLTPASDGHSISCLNHAISITSIIHQVLEETDILNGWHAAFGTQWNATLSIFGFMLGNPICPPTPSARKTMQTVATVFDKLGTDLASAASAANVVRDMSSLAQQLIQKFRDSLSLPSSSQPSPQSLQTQASQHRNTPITQQRQQRQITLPGTQPQPSKDKPQPSQQHRPFHLASITMPTEFLPSLSSSPTLLDQLPHPMASGMPSQWQTAISMDMTPDMAAISDSQLRGGSNSGPAIDPWNEFMADVQHDPLDQSMVRWA